MILKAVEAYLSLRRATGYEIRNASLQLLSFARFAHTRGDEHVKVSTAQAWAAMARSPAQRECRLQTVVRLARHAHCEDEQHEIPPPNSFGARRDRRPPPFLFTKEQIRRLLEEVGKSRRSVRSDHTHVGR